MFVIHRIMMCGCICPALFLLDKMQGRSFFTQTGYSTNLWRCLNISKDMIVNEGIRARELRVIDANGEQLGIKSKNEALEIASSQKSRSCISCSKRETTGGKNYGLW